MNAKNITIGLIIIMLAAFGIQALIDKKAPNTTPKVSINDLGVFNSADRASAVERFAGKPAVIFIVGTFCPYCQNAMPTYKTDIWDVYGKDTQTNPARIHVFANVTDGQGGNRFAVSGIPQGVDAKLDYKTLVGEECNYVPSWVLLDDKGSVVDSSCGATKGIDILKKGIETQLSQ